MWIAAAKIPIHIRIGVAIIVTAVATPFLLLMVVLVVPVFVAILCSAVGLWYRPVLGVRHPQVVHRLIQVGVVQGRRSHWRSNQDLALRSQVRAAQERRWLSWGVATHAADQR